jgi:hypothetical protein
MIEAIDKIREQAAELSQATGTDLLDAVIEQADQMKQTLVGVLEDMTQLDAVNDTFDEQGGPVPMGQPVMPTEGKPVMPVARKKTGQDDDNLTAAIKEFVERYNADPEKAQMGPGGGWDALLHEVAQKYDVNPGDIEYPLIS